MIVSNIDPIIPRNQDNSIDWLGVRQMAREQNDWYGTWTSQAISDEQRLINLWYMYACLTGLGYAFYAKSAICSIAWFASGYNPGVWQSRVFVQAYTEFQGSTPHYDTSDPPIILWYEGSVQYLPYNSLNESFQGNGIPTGWAYVPPVTNIKASGSPGYGIIQWTPYTGIKGAVTQTGLEWGEDWAPWWPGNGTLQMYALDWQRRQSMDPNYQWSDIVKWNVTNHESDPYGRVLTTLLWDDFMTDACLDDPNTDPDWKTTDEKKFDFLCYQWLSHYIGAGGRQLEEGKPLRHQIYNDYIKDAFTTWDQNGGADFLDAPPAIGVWMDPWHRTIIMASQRRKKNRVRTILR